MMINYSFLGISRGTIRDLVSSGFFVNSVMWSTRTVNRGALYCCMLVTNLTGTNFCQNELQLLMETVVGVLDFATAPRQHLAGHVIVVHISGDEWQECIQV